MSESNQEGTGKRQELDAAPAIEPKADDSASGVTTPTETVSGAERIRSGDADGGNVPNASGSPEGAAPSQPVRTPASNGGKDGGSNKAGGGRKGGTAALWILVVLLVVAVSYLGWQHWLQTTSDPGDHREVSLRLDRELAEVDGNIVNVRRELESQLVAAEQRAELREEDLRDRLREQQGRLNEITQAERSDWLLIEADYLVRLASQRLLVDRDTAVALGLLENADQLVRDLDDPDLLGLRQAIATDLTALRLAERVDRSGLYLRVESLQKAVAELPLERHEHSLGERIDVEAGTEVDGRPTAAWWRRPLNALRSAWGHLDNHIRIYRRDQPLQPLLSPDEELYLRLNLRLMLEQAQLAVLQREQEVYTASLVKAQEWLKDYFVNDDRNQALQNELAALLEFDVVETVPDLSGSLDAMRQVMRARPQARGDRESRP